MILLASTFEPSEQFEPIEPLDGFIGSNRLNDWNGLNVYLNLNKEN